MPDNRFRILARRPDLDPYKGFRVMITDPGHQPRWRILSLNSRLETVQLSVSAKKWYDVSRNPQNPDPPHLFSPFCPLALAYRQVNEQ